MSVLARLTRAPVRFKALGVEYELRPMPLSRMTQYRKWAKEEIFREARETLALLGDDAPADVKSQVWNKALKDSADPLNAPAINSADGLKEYIYLSLLDSHPGILRERVYDMLSTEVIATIMEGLEALKASDDAGNPPRTA